MPLFESETFKLKVDLNLQCFKSKIIFRLNKKKKELVSKVESAMKKINDLQITEEAKMTKKKELSDLLEDKL